MRLISSSFRCVAMALAPALICIGAEAQETDFLSRFDGAWSGAGMVQRKPEEGPHKVNCRMSGQSGENRVSISGSCRAYLVFSRQIGADIVFDPASGRYTGTYVGSTVGPASLSGTRDGDAVNLTITWPKLVNGDTTARMSIQNSGNGQLRIVVADQAAPDAPETSVTEITLSGG